MTLDEAFERAVAIFSDAAGGLTENATEEDAKIQIINRLLTECLGWAFADIGAERAHESGYSDYVISDDGRPAFLVEAKRVGKCDIGTAEPNSVRYLKLSGPGLKAVVAGIEQAASYAMPNGLPFALVTDGLSWIVFRPHVPSENYKNKEAIVFPSANAVLDGFQIFYELLSKVAFRKRLYSAVFDRVHQPRLMLTRSLYTALPDNEIKINQKTDIAFELDRIFETFFSRLTGDEDEDLLIECFVETRESRFADFALEKMTASVLGNLSPIEKDVDEELSAFIEAVADVETKRADGGQTIFIVGPTGSGKTTFLDRFFRKTLSKSLRGRCLLLRVNLLDSTGSVDGLIPWLTEQLIEALEAQLFDEGHPTFEQLQGLYQKEYTRRAKGPDAQLYARDKSAFKEKFGVFLGEVVEADREGYLKRLLSDVVSNRKLLPVLLLDNSDEFALEFKLGIFQFAQSLRRHAQHCLLIFPVTDKSAWSFSKTDMFGIYQSRSFFLPTPPPREVFRKRIEYLRGKLSQIESGRTSGTYLSDRGIRVSIGDVGAFARILEEVFVAQEITASTIGELTNFNIRRTLLLSRRVITSSVFKIDDLLRAYISGSELTPSFSKFMNALLKGDLDAYRRGDGSEVYPIFEEDAEIRHSPLLRLRILTLLKAVRDASRSIDERHLSVQSIVDYFGAIGCHETAVTRALLSLLESNLIEPYDVSVRDLQPEQRLAIASAGVIHAHLALHNAVFCEQMALTTPIADREVALQLRTLYRAGGDRLTRMGQMRAIFLKYLLDEDEKQLSTQADSEQYRVQAELLRGLAAAALPKAEDRSGRHLRGPDVRENITAQVDWFDPIKGFGFVMVDGLDEGVFVHADRLAESGFDTLTDVDELVCDIEYGRRGWSVTRITQIMTNPEKVETVSGTIIRLFPDRAYGFVRLNDGIRDAFFHYSVIPENVRQTLVDRDRVRVEIAPDSSGRLQVRKFLSRY